MSFANIYLCVLSPDPDSIEERTDGHIGGWTNGQTEGNLVSSNETTVGVSKFQFNFQPTLSWHMTSK